MRKKLLSAISLAFMGFVNAQQPNGLISVHNFDDTPKDILKNIDASLEQGAMFTKDRFGRDSSAVLLDGENDYVNLSATTLYQFTNEFTFSIWLDQEGASSYVGSSYSGSGIIFNREGEYEVGITKEGQLIYAIATNQHQWAWKSTNITVDSTKWSHLVVTLKSGKLSFYLNGFEEGIFNVQGTIQEQGSSTSSLDELRIGGRQASNAQNQVFNGKIDDVKIYNVALDEVDVERLYSEEQLEYSPSLIAKYELSGNVNEQVNDIDGDLPDGEYVEDRFGMLESAVKLDGVNDYIQLTETKAFEFTSDFSISLWLDQDGASSFVGSSHSGSGIIFNREGEYEVAVTQTGDIIYAVATNNHGWAWKTTTITLDSTKWSNLVVTIGSDSLKFYVDGQEEGSYYVPGIIQEQGSSTSSWDDLRIGGRQATNGLSQVFNGKVDDIAIYGNVLSPEMIQAMYQDSKPLFVKDFKGNHEFSVFPNPTSNTLFIEGVNDAVGSINDLNGVKIMNVIGKSIDVSSLEKGVYILNAKSSNGETIISKFIKE